MSLATFSPTLRVWVLRYQDDSPWSAQASALQADDEYGGDPTQYLVDGGHWIGAKDVHLTYEAAERAARRRVA